MQTFIYLHKFDVYRINIITMINECCLETKTSNVFLYSTAVEEVAKQVAKPIVLFPDLALPLVIVGILVYSLFLKSPPPVIPKFKHPVYGGPMRAENIEEVHGVYNNLNRGIPGHGIYDKLYRGRDNPPLLAPGLNEPRVGVSDLPPIVIVEPPPVIPEIPWEFITEILAIDNTLTWWGVSIAVKFPAIIFYGAFLGWENLLNFIGHYPRPRR